EIILIRIEIECPDASGLRWRIERIKAMPAKEVRPFPFTRGNVRLDLGHQGVGSHGRASNSGIDKIEGFGTRIVDRRSTRYIELGTSCSSDGIGHHRHSSPD